VRLVLYTGKGGVGKTTTAAATAVAAGRRGRRVLVASTDAAHSLGDVLGVRLGPAPATIEPRLDAVELDARAEVERQWGRIRDWLVALFRYQGIEEIVADELAQLPGAEEVTTLLGVERHLRSGKYDCVVLDCAPTGATLRLVTLPDVAHGALRVLLRVQGALAAVVTPIARELIPVPLPDRHVFQDAE
jgi:arsenite-transporting ATPase